MNMHMNMHMNMKHEHEQNMNINERWHQQLRKTRHARARDVAAHMICSRVVSVVFRLNEHPINEVSRSHATFTTKHL